jgi:hypothetical protein
MYFTHFSATSRMQEKVSDMTNSFHHFLGPKEPKKIAVVDRLAHPCGNLLWGTQIGEVFSTTEVEVRDLDPTITSTIELLKSRFPGPSAAEYVCEGLLGGYVGYYSSGGRGDIRSLGRRAKSWRREGLDILDMVMCERGESESMI